MWFSAVVIYCLFVFIIASLSLQPLWLHFKYLSIYLVDGKNSNNSTKCQQTYQRHERLRIMQYSGFIGTESGKYQWQQSSPLSSVHPVFPHV